ncbi:MAG: TIR domain-containing protein, partial [Treponema sp.]|nr:TIR domain-containing protein [Treponema sp.]
MKREEFDVFISYKESENGIKTKDSLDAKLLYDNFLLEGISSIFYAPEVLKDIIGEWDSYIDQALKNSKLLILLASEVGFINSEHVKSEWSRFLEYNPSKIVV